MEYKPLVISCVASQDTRKCLPCATDCSHSPGITFRKSLFSVFPRGTGQQELLWAAELGTVGLVLRTAQHRANAAPSHTHMQVVVVLPLLFHFPSLPLLVLPSLDAARGLMSSKAQEWRAAGDGHQC